MFPVASNFLFWDSKWNQTDVWKTQEWLESNICTSMTSLCLCNVAKYFWFFALNQKNWPYFKRKYGLVNEEELVLTNVCSSSDFPIWTFFSSEKDKFLREISSTMGGPENEFVENVWKLQNLTKLETCIWYYGLKIKFPKIYFTCFFATEQRQL